MTTSKLFQVIDFDRVLFDTERFARALTDGLRSSDPILAEKLHHAFEDAYAKEETFFLMRALREMMDEQFALFVETIVREHGGGEAFLLPGAKERLAIANAITDARPSIGILTYGDEIDQRMKLEIAGLADIPVVLSPTPNKSEVLRLWQRPDGVFQLPLEFGAQTVTNITLEDDKLRAFDDMPPGVTGIWINTASTAKPSGSLKRVSSLFESINYLRNQ